MNPLCQLLAGRFRSSNPVVFPDDDSGAAFETGPPVLEGFNLFKPVELSYILEPLVDELPGAGTVEADLASVFPRTATGSVQHVLGAPCDRADTAVLVQHAGTAGGAFLRPHPPFFENT